MASVALDPAVDPPRIAAAPDGETRVIALAGDWRDPATRPSFGQLLSSAAGRGPARVIDGGLTGWDSGLLAMLNRLRGDLAAEGRAVAFDLPPGMRALLDLADHAKDDIGPADEAGEPSLLAKVSGTAQDVARTAGDVLGFVGETTLSLGRLLTGRARVRWADFAAILQDCTVRALPIVSLIAVLIGLILAFVGAVQLRQFGVELYVANLVAIGMLREMGPIMTAIVMAGRTGAAFAAELGTMQVNEEIDALSTFGFRPIDTLVLPRMLALIVAMPLLCLYADVLGILGGALIGITLLDLPLLEYWTQTKSALRMTDLLIGLSKAAVFGVIIAVTGCHRGMAAGRSAAAVGLATTSAVVSAIVLIVVADGLFAVLLDILRL